MNHRHTFTKPRCHSAGIAVHAIPQKPVPVRLLRKRGYRAIRDGRVALGKPSSMSALVVGAPVSALSVEIAARTQLAFDVACQRCGMHTCAKEACVKRKEIRTYTSFDPGIKESCSTVTPRATVPALPAHIAVGERYESMGREMSIEHVGGLRADTATSLCRMSNGCDYHVPVDGALCSVWGLKHLPKLAPVAQPKAGEALSVWRKGDSVRCITNRVDCFTEGSVYVLREYCDAGGQARVVADDKGKPNGAHRQWFERIPAQPSPGAFAVGSKVMLKDAEYRDRCGVGIVTEAAHVGQPRIRCSWPHSKISSTSLEKADDLEPVDERAAVRS